MARAMKKDLPIELQELWDSLLMPVDTNINFDKVILSPENTEKYQAFIKEYSYKEKLREYGLQPMNRLLLYGASGTGKTFSLKALSNLLDFTMLYVDIAKALEDDAVANNISNIFRLGNYIAEHYGGCIIFLDECDSIAWNRDSGTSESGKVRRATNSIFQCLDQMSPDCIFCSATNMLHRLDAAFERRFQLKFKFTRPETDLDEDIKKFLFPKFELDDNVDSYVRDTVKKKAKKNVKLSYYEIQCIVERAMKNAVLRNSNVVSVSEIYEMLAENMNFKIRFHTENDNEEIFGNDYTYDPDENKNNTSEW